MDSFDDQKKKCGFSNINKQNSSKKKNPPKKWISKTK